MAPFDKPVGSGLFCGGNSSTFSKAFDNTKLAHCKGVDKRNSNCFQKQAISTDSAKSIGIYICFAGRDEWLLQKQGTFIHMNCNPNI